jgi:lipopolysaccharide transport system ATP-binding protein
MKIIEVKNLSKKYVLRSSQRKMTMRDTIVGAFDFLKRKDERQKTLWALKEINFSVEEGETVGLIGNNGAGKSTLLKILSRIIRPTGGEATLHGRTGSLLEVGTGFHRELSGRENIFLNGAILGMKRKEIEAKFDEIVEFSEMEEFLETPIKHYSSGMFTRLAFAVAAHLEPEILMVDEVLAVGDLAFQRKCLSKMRDVNKKGRTILFVSHNMQAITRLCKRAIWIRDGEIQKDGEANEVVSFYLNSQIETSSKRYWKDSEDAPGNDIARLREVRVCDERGTATSTFDIRKPVFIEITYDVLQNERVLMPSFQLFNDEGICVFVSHDLDEKWRHQKRRPGRYTSRAEIPPNFLAEGNFFVAVSASTYEPFSEHFNERDVAAFLVTDGLEGDSARGDYAGTMQGVVRPIFKWETDFNEKRD